MKRFLLLCLIVSVLLASLPMVAFADYTLPQYVRIGLMYGNGAVKTVTLESDVGFLLGDYQEREFVQTAETSETKLIVKLAEGEISVADENGTVLHAGKDSVGILPDASGLNQVLKVDEVSYRGGIHCIKAGEAMTVVNVVFMDHYLYGVISREMSPSWPVEALKAQAVCARNYAAQSLGKHKNQGFDLCSSVDCQAYSGTRAEAIGSYAPVDETTRQVLTYDGELAQLFYSSSMGATTEDVKNVWGNSLPYLISVDNSYEDTENIPNGVWEGYLSCEEATTIMRNKGYDVGDVTEIEVLEYSANQRVVKMEVTGTKGSKVFEREACRTIFNTVTKSQAFSVTGDRGNGAPEAVQVTNGTDTVKLAMDKLVLLTGKGRESLEGALCVFDGENKKSYGDSKESNKNQGFRFNGTGWGHSVGMSQYGAKGMAEAGYTYQEILAHYFVGTNLENAY